MILFCDTSALVKLYVSEAGTSQITELAQAARGIAVSRISWAESMAAFARRVREQPSDAAAIELVRAQLRADWQDFLLIEVSQALVELAGDYADTFALRGYDSIQLAAARLLQQGLDESICFACFDTRLQKAARILGMATLGQ